MKIISAVFLSFIFASCALASDSTYDAVVAGKKCQEGKNQSLSCSYTVGKNLLIEIAGIGSPDAGIAFLKSDYDGDFYGKYGVLHGCIIINSTKDLFSFAFVSPKNGKIYRTWQECKSGM
ncbi:MAG: hypothetical protein Q7J84_17280 [Sulfuricaulis sp.]|nr:hypothetical protein [Sulfuricaulis sp.]